VGWRKGALLRSNLRMLAAVARVLGRPGLMGPHLSDHAATLQGTMRINSRGGDGETADPSAHLMPLNIRINLWLEKFFPKHGCCGVLC